MKQKLVVCSVGKSFFTTVNGERVDLNYCGLNHVKIHGKDHVILSPYFSERAGDQEWHVYELTPSPIRITLE